MGKWQASVNRYKDGAWGANETLNILYGDKTFGRKTFWWHGRDDWAMALGDNKMEENPRNGEHCPRVVGN